MGASVFCPKCGKELSDDSQFCAKCGHALSSSAPKSPTSRKAFGWIAVAILGAGALSVLIWQLFFRQGPPAPSFMLAQPSASHVSSGNTASTTVPEVRVLSPQDIFQMASGAM